MNSEPPPAAPDGESPEPQPEPASAPEPEPVPEPEPAPAQPKPEPRIATWIKIVGGILGIALTATTLYFLFFPPDEGCHSSRSGTLGAPIVDVGVSYRRFLQITNQEDPGARPSTLSRLGTMIDVPITAVGYVDKPLPLRWTTLTSKGREVPEAGLTDQLALEFVPEDCSDKGRRRLWAAWPSKKDDYLVEVTLLDDDDELLDTRRTTVFAVPER